MTDGQANTHEDGTSLEWLIPCCCCWCLWTTGIQSYLLSLHTPQSHRWYSETRHCKSELCTVKGASLQLLYHMQPGSLQTGPWSCEGVSHLTDQRQVCEYRRGQTISRCTRPPKVPARLVYFQFIQFPVVWNQATPTHIAIVAIKLALEKQRLWMCED